MSRAAFRRLDFSSSIRSCAANFAVFPMKLPLRVLVLCTANSARSQIAEALLRDRGAGRVEVMSAGTEPAEDVNPGALRVLAKHDLLAPGSSPKSIAEVWGAGFDVVITVCDQAREACPLVLGPTVVAHWGVEDPVGASHEAAAFEQAFEILSQRVDALLSLRLVALEPTQFERELDRIGSVGLSSGRGTEA